MKRFLIPLLAIAALTQACTARTAAMATGALVGLTAAAVIAEAIDDDDHERGHCSCRDRHHVRHQSDDYGYDGYDR